MTQEVFAILRNIPSLSHAPHNALIAIVAIAAVVGFVMLLLILFFITDFVKVERDEKLAPDSHRLIMDLQKTLVQEMRGTAKQNALMINLTILFILISLIGILASIFGGQAMIDFFRNLWQHFTTVAPKTVKPVKHLIHR